MNCTEIQTLIGPYLDSELDVRTTLAVREHLTDCPTCAATIAAEEQAYARLDQALRRGPHTESLWAELAQRIRTAGADPSPTAPANPTPVTGRSPHEVGWRFWLWPSPRFHAGLAAVWVVLLAAHLAGREHETPRSRPPAASASPLARTTVVAQRQLLAELLELAGREPAPRQLTPGRTRSERAATPTNV
ncbi:MAG: hypothetical protein FJ387_23225 [Verrucomicrobia bacterium]|nr:hypothetical protein [Verrucomicrobiota bacterium]